MAAEFGSDGTRALPPLPVFTDPVAGLITGSSFVVDDKPIVGVPVASGPPALDPEAVQAALKAVIAQEERRRQQRIRQAQPRHPAYVPQAPVAAAPVKQGGSSGCVGCLFALLIIGVAAFAIVQSLLP
jgi:hypothetical protein